MNYPETKKIEHEEEIHGQVISDPYRWLEQDNNPEVLEWLDAQENYTSAVLSENTNSKEVKKKLEKVFRVDSYGLVVPRGNKYFFLKKKSDEDLAVLYIKEGLGGEPVELLNPNNLSKDKSKVLAGWNPSPNGELLVYQISDAGNDKYSIHLMDVKTGAVLDDHIPADIYPGIHRWDRDNSGFWYTRRAPDAPEGEDKFHKRIYFHKVGDSYEKDSYVFGEDLDKADIPFVDVSEDGRHLIFHVFMLTGKKRQREVYILDREQNGEKPQKIFGEMDAEAFGEIHRGCVYLMTNYNAPKQKVISSPLSENMPPLEEWLEVIPESEDTLVGVSFMRGKIFAEYLHNASSQVFIFDTKGKNIGELELPNLGTLDGIRGEEEGSELFFKFSSYLTPPSIYCYNLEEEKSKLVFSSTTPFNFDNFEVSQKWFTSKDGTRIPMFIVQKKGIAMDGQNPTLVYGYGGFNHPTTPGYRAWILPFLEDGGIYVEVNMRGGGEFGQEWNDGGARGNKQNVFDDFAAALEYLIKNKYTSPEKIAIFGWSNGGLLASAMAIQRPDLMKVSIVGAPVVDMLRYHLFHGGRLWIAEYGDPDKKEDAEFLLKYSPYHNVEKKDYPAILIVTADKDDRVHPGQAYKITASFQEKNISSNPILVRVEKQAGHSGANATSKTIERYGDILGFMYWQLGMKVEQG